MKIFNYLNHNNLVLHSYIHQDDVAVLSSGIVLVHPSYHIITQFSASFLLFCVSSFYSFIMICDSKLFDVKQGQYSISEPDSYSILSGMSNLSTQQLKSYLREFLHPELLFLN